MVAQRRQRGERRGFFGPAVSCPEVGRGGDDAVDATQAAGAQRGIAEAADAHAEVRTLAHQVHVPVAEIEIDRQGGVLAGEVVHDRAEVTEPEAQRQRHAQRAGERLPLGADARLGVVELGEQCSRALEEALARFGRYHDPRHVQHGALRVVNDDEVAGCFPAHPHRDAEIFSYVLEGSLQHRDSMGNGSVVGAGGVRYMSAGRGVTHSEFNPSETERMRFLQVWLLPIEGGGEPRYDTLDIPADEKRGRFRLFLSPDGRDGSIASRSTALVYAATLDGDARIEHGMIEGGRGWLQVARGSLRIDGVVLGTGDGVAIDGGGTFVLDGADDAEVLLFDVL